MNLIPSTSGLDVPCPPYFKALSSYRIKYRDITAFTDIVISGCLYHILVFINITGRLVRKQCNWH